ncbi:MAG: hypothetical protein HZC44_09450 [Geobacter sp.]|nr:hypothetical protein [Geobacter sp.]
MHDPREDHSGLMPLERDACAIICHINKEVRPTHGNLQRTIEALIRMGHRAGEINGEGDGCGIMTDIPRLLWEEILANAGHAPALAHDPGLAVGHFLVERHELERHPDLQSALLSRIREAGLKTSRSWSAPARSGICTT